MQEVFDRLLELLEKGTKYRFSIRYMHDTQLGHVWCCRFRPMSDIWDGNAARTIFARDLEGLYSQAYDILHDKEIVQEGSMKEELGV